jgi:APA family basic amino acid/polyamine antiporter
VLHRALGPIGSTLITVGIITSTLGFVSVGIMTAPRILQAMAADGLFLPNAARLHPRFRTPHVALVIQGVWAVVLTLSGTYGQLLDYTVFGDWIFFGLIVATIFRYRAQDRHAPVGEGRGGSPGYRAPLYPLLPALFVVTCAYVVTSSIASNPLNALIGTGLIALGVPVFLWYRRRAGAPGETAP